MLPVPRSASLIFDEIEVAAPLASFILDYASVSHYLPVLILPAATVAIEILIDLLEVLIGDEVVSEVEGLQGRVLVGHTRQGFSGCGFKEVAREDKGL